MPKQKQTSTPNPVQRIDCFFDCMKLFTEKEPGGCVEPNGRIIIKDPYPSYPSDACWMWDTRRRNHHQKCRLECGAALPSDIRDIEFRRAFGSGGNNGLPNSSQ